MNKENSQYVVVFRGKGGRDGNHEGIITWTAYPSKEVFEERFTAGKILDEVIAEGIDIDEAILMARMTPFYALLRAAIVESTGDDGNIIQGQLAIKLESLQAALTFMDYRINPRDN